MPLLLLAVGAVVFSVSLIAPYQTDDFCALMRMYRPGSLPEGAPRLVDFLAIQNRLGVFGREIWDIYMAWGGRYLAWIVTMPLIAAPRYVFATVNAFLWVGLCWFVWRLSDVGRRGFPLVMALVILVGLDSEAVFWMSGSFSYLCAMVPAFALVCVWRRIGQSDGRPCRWYEGLALALVGFLFVGGHETVAVMAGAAVVGHWVWHFRSGSRIRKCQVWFSAGCLMGAAACVLAPGNFVRAAQKATFAKLSVGEWLKMKAMCLPSSFYESPVLCLLVGVLLLAVFSRRFRRLLDGWDWCWLWAVCANLLFVLTVTNGGSRPLWFAQLVAILLLLRILRKAPVFSHASIRVTLTLLACVAAAMTLYRTGMATLRGNALLARIYDDWAASSDGVVCGGDYLAFGRESYFDRSIHGVVGWGTGEEYVTYVMAQCFQRPRLVLLDAWTYRNVYAHDRALTNGAWRLPRVKGWVASPDEDVLVGPCPDGNYGHGQSVWAFPLYDKTGMTPLFSMPWPERLSAGMDVIRRTNVCPWTDSLPWQEILYDIPLKGCVLETACGRRYVIVRHNRHVDRSRLMAIRIEPADEPFIGDGK